MLQWCFLLGFVVGVFLGKRAKIFLLETLFRSTVLHFGGEVWSKYPTDIALPTSSQVRRDTNPRRPPLRLPLYLSRWMNRSYGYIGQIKRIGCSANTRTPFMTQVIIATPFFLDGKIDPIFRVRDLGIDNFFRYINLIPFSIIRPVSL